METNKLLPLSGIAFVALVILAIPVLGWGSPGSTTAPAEVVAYYQEHNAEQFIASFVIAASVPFLVLFALGLSAARSTEGRSTWQRMLVGGSFVTGAVLLVIAMTNFALADGADNGASADAVQALNLIIGNAWVALNAGLGVLMLGAAGTFLTRPRSGWIGWTSLVLGVALFIPIADFFALLLTGPWMIATGIALSRRPEQRHVAHAAPSLS
jgi:hypothetical protein